MASLDNRITQLERRANPESLGTPYIMLTGTDIDTVKADWEKAHNQTLPDNQPVIFFEIIKPSGDAHAIQPKQQP